jgi:hypothetical protein
MAILSRQPTSVSPHSPIHVDAETIARRSEVGARQLLGETRDAFVIPTRGGVLERQVVYVLDVRVSDAWGS